MHREIPNVSKCFDSAFVAAICRMKPDQAAFKIWRQSEVGVAHFKRAGDLISQVAGNVAAIKTADKLGANPMLREGVIGGCRAGREIERHRSDGQKNCTLITPGCGREFWRRYRETATMSEQVTHGHLLLPLLPKLGPIGSNKVDQSDV